MSFCLFYTWAHTSPEVQMRANPFTLGQGDENKPAQPSIPIIASAGELPPRWNQPHFPLPSPKKAAASLEWWWVLLQRPENVLLLTHYLNLFSLYKWAIIMLFPKYYNFQSIWGFDLMLSNYGPRVEPLMCELLPYKSEENVYMNSVLRLRVSLSPTFNI